MKKYRSIIIFIGTICVVLVVYLLFTNILSGRDIEYFDDLSYYDEMSNNPDDYPAIRDIEELDNGTKKLCYEFLEICEQRGLPVMIIETYRTQERQDFLYAQGRANDENIVTWTRNSYHIKRKAFDIAKNEKGNEFGDEDFFRKCAEIGESLGLESGYYWENQDMGHFENK